MNRKNVYILLLLLGAAGFAKPLHAEVYSDRIAAVVNGDVILESDVKKQKQPATRSLINLPLGIIPPGKWPTEREVLDELIVIHLLEQAAAKKGIKVDERGVDASIEAIKTRNHITQDQFVLALAAKGLNYPEYRKIMKRQLTLTRLLASEVTQKVPMSEEDAQLYFKKNQGNIEELFKKMVESLTPSPPPEEAKPNIPTHEELYVGGKLRLRQITLKLPADKNRKGMEKVKEQALQIYRQAMTGADFGQLAKKYSKDPMASKGGDLGVMDYKDMVPGMQKVMQHLKPGDVSPPLAAGDSLIMFYLADAKGRTVKKVPIPPKMREQLEKRWEENMKKQRNQEQPPAHEVHPGNDAGDDRGKEEAESPSSNSKGVLTPAEEKEYRKVRGKVIALVRNEAIQKRMKEYIEELKKASIIEVKL